MMIDEAESLENLAEVFREEMDQPRLRLAMDPAVALLDFLIELIELDRSVHQFA